MITDDEVGDKKKLQNDINIEGAKISLSSGKIDKYENLTG